MISSLWTSSLGPFNTYDNVFFLRRLLDQVKLAIFPPDISWR